MSGCTAHTFYVWYTYLQSYKPRDMPHTFSITSKVAESPHRHILAHQQPSHITMTTSITNCGGHNVQPDRAAARPTHQPHHTLGHTSSHRAGMEGYCCMTMFCSLLRGWACRGFKLVPLVLPVWRVATMGVPGSVVLLLLWSTIDLRGVADTPRTPVAVGVPAGQQVVVVVVVMMQQMGHRQPAGTAGQTVGQAKGRKRGRQGRRRAQACCLSFRVVYYQA